MDNKLEGEGIYYNEDETYYVGDFKKERKMEKEQFIIKIVV